MGEKSERWAFARIRELERLLKESRSAVVYQRRRAELWKARALRKGVKR